MDLDKDCYQAVKAYHNGDFDGDIKRFLASDEAAEFGFGLEDHREFKRATKCFDARWQAAAKVYFEGNFKRPKTFVSSYKFLKLGFFPSRENVHILRHALRFYEEEMDFRETAKSNRSVALATRGWGSKTPLIVSPSRINVISNFIQNEQDHISVETSGSLGEMSLYIETSGSLCETSVSQNSSGNTRNGSSFGCSDSSISHTTMSSLTKECADDSCVSSVTQSVTTNSDIGEPEEKEEDYVPSELKTSEDETSVAKSHEEVFSNGSLILEKFPATCNNDLGKIFQDILKDSTDSNALSNLVFFLFAVVPLLVPLLVFVKVPYSVYVKVQSAALRACSFVQRQVRPLNMVYSLAGLKHEKAKENLIKCEVPDLNELELSLDV